MNSFNVVLMVASGLRLDLPAEGYPRNTTPLLAKSLSRARVYSGCRSTSVSILSSCASIVSGRPAVEHGLADHDGRFRVPKLGHFLGPEYFSFGIGNHPDLAPDDTEDPDPRPLRTEQRKGGSRFGWDLDFDAYRGFDVLDHDGPFNEAERFLREHRSDPRPFFLFFQTSLIQGSGLDRPCDHAVEEWFRGDLPVEWRHSPEGAGVREGLRTRDEDAALAHQIRARYDCGVVELDRRLATLFDLIDFDRTVVILASDHATQFRFDLDRGQHGVRLQDDRLRVPLALWVPSAVGAKVGRFERVCSTLDVVPTVLHVLGRPDPGLPGHCLTLPLAAGHRLLHWATDCERQSAQSSADRGEAELLWPLKWVRIVSNGRALEQCFNLARDPREERDLLSLPPASGLPSLSIVVVINDWAEFEQNAGRSPLRIGGRHQWILFDNTDNRLSGDLCRLYIRGLAQAQSEIVLFAHQDVFFPPGWEHDFARALADLEMRDPAWGVIGPVGVALDANDPAGRTVVGHWSDPSGYAHSGELPTKVQSLDEQWLCVRRASGVTFDENLPGLHCYGMDICLTARSRGLHCYAIDAFSWHKYRRPDGSLVLARSDSPTTMRRVRPAFIEEVQPSYHYVARKWRDWYPFRSTSMDWIDAESPFYSGPRALRGPKKA